MKGRCVQVYCRQPVWERNIKISGIYINMSTNNTVLGVVRSDGSYDTLPEGMAIHPDLVDEIVTPISLPWKDNVRLEPLPLADFGQGGEERPMGEETHYATTFEGTNPSSGERWFIEITLFEYPQGDLQVADVQTGGDASFAHFSPNDLQNYMYAVL